MESSRGKPVLKVFFVSTPHAFSDRHDFFGARQKVLAAVSPHVYVHEVAFEASSKEVKASLERGEVEALKHLYVNDFTLEELKHVLSRNVGVRLLESELSIGEKKTLLDLASGVGPGLTRLNSNELPLPGASLTSFLGSDLESKGKAYRKLIVTVKNNAFDENAKEHVRKASLAALHFLAFTRQDKLARAIVDSKNYSGHLQKPEVRVMACLGIGHETFLETFKRHVEEGHANGFSSVELYHLFMDENGNVRADDKLKRVYGGKLRDVLRKSGFPYPMPESQKAMEELERRKRASLESRLTRLANKLAFWRRL